MRRPPKRPRRPSELGVSGWIVVGARLRQSRAQVEKRGALASGLEGHRALLWGGLLGGFLEGFLGGVAFLPIAPAVQGLLEPKP